LIRLLRAEDMLPTFSTVSTQSDQYHWPLLSGHAEGGD
jgi:hypothetical protein